MTSSSARRIVHRKAWLALGATVLLGAQGLTFLVVPPVAGAAGVTVAQSCSSSNIVQIGTGGLGSAIAGPIATSFGTTPFNLPIGVDATATSTVAPGGTIDYTVAITVDLQTLVSNTLTNSVIPGVVAQSPGLAPSVYLEETLTDLAIPFPLPAGTTISGSPSASGSGASASLTSGTVRVLVPSLSAGAYQAGTGTPGTTIAPKSPATVNLSFSVTTSGGAADGTIIPLNPGPATFGLRYSVGLLALASTGGITATQTCTTNSALVLASTSIAAGGTSSTSSSSSSSSSSSTSSSSTSSSSSSTSTSTTSTTTSTSTTSTTAPPATDPGTIFVECVASDVSEVPGGNPAVSPPVVEGVKNTPYRFPVPWSSTVTPGAAGSATYSATLNYDFQALNNDTLVNNVAPAASAQIPGLGDTAFLEQDYTNLAFVFPLPAGATLNGAPTVTGTGAGSAVAVASGTGTVTVTIPSVKVGSYQPLSVATPQRPPVAPFAVTVDFELDGVTGAPVAIPPSTSTFGLTYVTGVALGGSGLSGGAVATQTCTISATVPPPPPPATSGTTVAPAAPDQAAEVAAANAVKPSGTLPYTGIDIGMVRLAILGLFLFDLGYLIVTATTDRTPMDVLRRRRA